MENYSNTSAPIPKDEFLSRVVTQKPAIRKNTTFSSTIKINNARGSSILKNKFDEYESESPSALKARARRRKIAAIDVPKVSLIPNNYFALDGDDDDGSEASSRQYFMDVGSTHDADLKTLRRFKLESFLDYESLRHLRRELTPEIVEFELDTVKKTALQEALKTVPKFKSDCEELQELKQEIKVPTLDMKFILSLPRMFTRSGVRFELPMDSRTLCDMTPIEYLRENVFVNSTRRLLYNCIFKIFRSQKLEDADGNECNENRLLGIKLPDALGVVMGERLSPRQVSFLRKLIGWYDNEEYDFKAFCTISALCERVLAKQFSKSYLDRTQDPCQEVERIDFESLDRKIRDKKIDKRLVRMLHLIQES